MSEVPKTCTRSRSEFDEIKQAIIERCEYRFEKAVSLGEISKAMMPEITVTEEYDHMVTRFVSTFISLKNRQGEPVALCPHVDIPTHQQHIKWLADPDKRELADAQREIENMRRRLEQARHVLKDLEHLNTEKNKEIQRLKDTIETQKRMVG